MANAIRVVNRQNQVLNILLWDKAGKKVENKSLLPRASIEIEADRLSEQVFDLNRHGHVVLTKVSKSAPVAPAKADKPTPASAAKAAKSSYSKSRF